MEGVDRLKRDHNILRSKLALMEYALETGPEAWYVLREVCFTLSKQLRDHIKREEDLVARCRRAMTPAILAEVVVEHRDEPEHLRTVNRVFASGATQTFDQVKPALMDVIRGLRCHMAEEERGLFPLLARSLSASLLGEAAASPPRRGTSSAARMVPPRSAALPSATPLDDTMTVNRVVQKFPATKRVFEQLFINTTMEGCTCLDEVAWRHGMESRELLEQLEQVIPACHCAGHDPSEHGETVRVGGIRSNAGGVSCG